MVKFSRTQETPLPNPSVKPRPFTLNDFVESSNWEGELAQDGVKSDERQYKYRCLYVSWYKFNTQCNIATCKYHSERVVSHCMAIDKRFPGGNRAISDNEIHYYKFDSKGTKPRTVALKRKMAITRVKGLVVLYHYVQFIRANFRPQQVRQSALARPLPLRIRSIMESYPLNVGYLDFQGWMVPFLFDSVLYKHFIEAYQSGSECHNYTLPDLIQISQAKYPAIEQEIASRFRRCREYDLPLAMETPHNAR